MLGAIGAAGGSAKGKHADIARIQVVGVGVDGLGHRHGQDLVGAGGAQVVGVGEIERHARVAARVHVYLGRIGRVDGRGVGVDRLVGNAHGAGGSVGPAVDNDKHGLAAHAAHNAAHAGHAAVLVHFHHHLVLVAAIGCRSNRHVAVGGEGNRAGVLVQPEVGHALPDGAGARGIGGHRNGQPGREERAAGEARNFENTQRGAGDDEHAPGVGPRVGRISNGRTAGAERGGQRVDQRVAVGLDGGEAEGGALVHAHVLNWNVLRVELGRSVGHIRAAVVEVGFGVEVGLTDDVGNEGTLILARAHRPLAGRQRHGGLVVSEVVERIYRRGIGAGAGGTGA